MKKERWLSLNRRTPLSRGGGAARLETLSGPLDRKTRSRLERAARAAAANAYAPYSKFRVGAAVLSGSGKIYAGCNVENASYGLCTCAERSAIAAAVSSGERTVSAVAVYTPTPSPTAPCGACRQIISEFGPAAAIISVCDSRERLESSISALLPLAFGRHDLLHQGRHSQRQ